MPCPLHVRIYNELVEAGLLDDHGDAHVCVPLQMWVQWRGWRTTVPGTLCTGPALPPPASPGTVWTRAVPGPSVDRLWSHSLKTTTPMCSPWTSAKSM